MNTQIQKLDEVRSEIEKVLSETDNLVITNRKTYGGVRSARTTVQRLITSIESRRVELKAPILAAERLIDSTARNLTTPLESRKIELVDKIKNYDDQKEKERLEKLLKEAARKLKIQESILEYRDIYLRKMEDADLEQLAEIIESLRGGVLEAQDFQEFLPQANAERDLLIQMVESKIATIQEKELQDARREYRTYFGTPECPQDLSAEGIYEVIHIAEVKQEEEDLTRARLEFIDFFGTESPIEFTADEIRESLKIGRELLEAAEAKRLIEETNARIEKENAEKILLVTPEVHATNEPIQINHSRDQFNFESYLGSIQSCVNNTPSVEWDDIISLMESIKKDLTECLQRVRKEYESLTL